uniref:mRNA capping enzyme adenylation domain-containing protein n=1 Tax=viral metagenome TaxID=1070528 RepID=A0A6C0IWR0_9ZZZZ
MKILFLIGRPNSGKTTQANLLAKAGNCLVVSPGDWLRSLSKNQHHDDLGSFVFHNWNHESLTPLVKDYLDKILETSELTVVVDGFPRNCAEVEALPSLCRGRPFLVIELQLCEEMTKERAKKRQRENDDTEIISDIRNQCYNTNIEAIKAELEKHHIEYVCLKCQRDMSAFDIHKQIVSTPIVKRIAIPPKPINATLARRYFTRAEAIISAIIIQRSMKMAQSTRLKKQFFGTHPISLTRENMNRVCTYPYLVSLKATGVRYMCCISDGFIYLLSRSMDVFVSFVASRDLDDFNNTLIDGELIGEQEAALFIVLDCLCYKGVNCMRKEIAERLQICRPLLEYYSDGHGGSFFMRQQGYVKRENLDTLLSTASSLPWAIDGIIFQPEKLPYRLGIDYNMFKWKPLGENSVDFYYNDENLGLYCKRSDAAKSSIFINGYDMIQFGRLLKSMKPNWLRDGMIIECAALPSTAHTEITIEDEEKELLKQYHNIIWLPRHARPDKTTGNIDWVAEGVVQSIIDDITQDEVQRLCSVPRRRPS